VSLFAARFALMTVVAIAPTVAVLADLMETTGINWTSHTSLPVSTAKFNLYVCRDHFPAGSAARKEIETAAGWYNKTTGAAIKVVLVETSHKGIDALYPLITSHNSFDYVDNSTQGFPCHDAGDTSDWITNTCKYAGTGWNKSAKTVFFTIAANATAVEHDTNPSATDYPTAANIAHSLGHAFGMIHSEKWPESDRGFISTMQDKVDGLSAYDVAFLRHIYRVSPVLTTTPDFVASNVVRIPGNDADGFRNVSWDKANPDQLYLNADGFYYDCATNASPVFNAAWFNTSTIAVGPSSSLNQFIIGPKGATTGVGVMLSHVATAAAGGSQESISITQTVPKAALQALDFDTVYRLTFKADSWNLLSETNELDGDNGEAKNIVLRSGRFACR
jgi:hypothetical protein